MRDKEIPITARIHKLTGPVSSLSFGLPAESRSEIEKRRKITQISALPSDSSEWISFASLDLYLRNPAGDLDLSAF